MSFELIPNEILLDVFDFFNGIELLRTFYGLNSRLNYVLHNRFQSCSFKFNTLSKHDFDMICRQYVPLMADCIPTLHLSDNDETPTQISLFLSYIPSFHRFTHLRSLSLLNLRSYRTLIKMIEECHHLCSLTHLELLYCYIQDNQVDFQLIIDHVWSLPKLTHCTMNIGIQGQCLFRMPTKVSSSLEYISIERTQIKLGHINRLVEYTPALKSLAISVQSFADTDYTPTPLPTLTNLTITSQFTCNASNMAIFLQNTPNLRFLNIDLSSELVDGDQWETLIRNHLPHLEDFRFKMKTTLPLAQNIHTRVNALINSFSSPFWVDEHRWFVRCFTWNRTIYLYTSSSNYEENLPVEYKSTCPYDDQPDFYNSITRIISPTFFDQPLPSYIRLPKINHLCITLPINDQFWSIVPNFDRLKSLQILYHTNTLQSQVQALLNRAPHLNRLIINQCDSTPLKTSLFKYKTACVRELDLRNINHCFNEEQCISLSRSPLGVQCEKLSVLVHNRQSIISLIKHMPKLRALNVRCKDDHSTELATLKEDNDVDCCDNNKENTDECIQWLKNNLPPACIIGRDPKLTCNILLWI